MQITHGSSTILFPPCCLSQYGRFYLCPPPPETTTAVPQDLPHQGYPGQEDEAEQADPALDSPSHGQQDPVRESTTGCEGMKAHRNIKHAYMEDRGLQQRRRNKDRAVNLLATATTTAFPSPFPSHIEHGVSRGFSGEEKADLWSSHRRDVSGSSGGIVCSWHFGVSSPD